MRVNLLAETDYSQKCNILFMLIKLLFNSNSTEKIVQQSSSMFVRLRQKHRRMQKLLFILQHFEQSGRKGFKTGVAISQKQSVAAKKDEINMFSLR